MIRRSVSFSEECPTIRVEFELDCVEPDFVDCTLVVRIVGEYRDGSTGNSDALYINGMIKAGIELWCPRAVVVDFRQMTYRWGDMLELIFESPGDLNAAFVVGPHCRRAMSTLIFGINTDDDIADEENCFVTIDDALKYVARDP